LLNDPRPRITGKAWICNGPQQAEWDFALVLPRPFGAAEEIDWASLLPPPNVTRWMAFDEGRRYITGRNLIDEQSRTFIWTDHKENLGLDLVNYLDRTDEIIHVSERDPSFVSRSTWSKCSNIFQCFHPPCARPQSWMATTRNPMWSERRSGS
jgi:hypothetical protein